MDKEMTVEEAVARIKDHKIIHKIDEGDARTFYISKALDMAIESLEKGPWIPITKYLPSDLGYDWVLAQIQEDNGYLWIPEVMEYRKEKDDWYSDINNLGWLKAHNGAFKVIAWMPLPAPYKEESEK